MEIWAARAEKSKPNVAQARRRNPVCNLFTNRSIGLGRGLDRERDGPSSDEAQGVAYCGHVDGSGLKGCQSLAPDAQVINISRAALFILAGWVLTDDGRIAR